LGRLSERLQVSGASGLPLAESQLTPSGWRLTLAMTVPRDAVPPFLGPRLIWSERGAPAIELELADPLDYSVTDLRGRLVNRVAFVRTALEYDPRTLDRGHLRVVSARMARQVCAIWPFFERHWLRVLPDFRKDAHEFQPPFSSKTLESIPYRWLEFDGPGLGCWGGVDGLFLASPESYPELGALGPVVAAVEAVTGLAQRNGKPGVLG
jgi:hypothetical protein